MKQILEISSLIIFFIVYKMYDIVTATGVLILTSALFLLIDYLINKKIEKMQVITFSILLVFGSFTFVTQDAWFIKLKVSIVYLLMAGALSTSYFVFSKDLIKTIFKDLVSAPDIVWKYINLAWISFFVILALLNYYIAVNFSENIWVNFKVFGALVASLIALILTLIYLKSKGEFKNQKIDK